MFKSWSVVSGKPKLQGMPQIRVNENESETLEVICEDDRAGIRLFLYYTIFENHGIVLRHQKVENSSEYSEYVSGTSGRRV